jgi:hypothetical protein
VRSLAHFPSSQVTVPFLSLLPSPKPFLSLHIHLPLRRTKCKNTAIIEKREKREKREGEELRKINLESFFLAVSHKICSLYFFISPSPFPIYFLQFLGLVIK